jgi:hypothetical protein
MVGRSSKILLPMIRIANTARPPTTPSARRCPRTCLCGPSLVRTANGLIHINEATRDRPKAMCQPSESYSDGILRLKSAHC